MLQATIEAVAARRSVTRTTHQQVVEGALEAVRLRREHEASVDLLPPREEEFRSDVAIRNSVDNLITSLHHMDHGDEPLPPPDEAYTADFSIRPIVEDSEEEAEGSPNAAEAFLNDDQRVRLQQQRWHSTGSSAETAMEGRAAPPAAAAAAEGSGEASGEAGGGGDDDGWLQGKIEERLLLQRRSVAAASSSPAPASSSPSHATPAAPPAVAPSTAAAEAAAAEAAAAAAVGSPAISFRRRDQANHGLDGEMRGLARALRSEISIASAAAAAETAAVAAAAASRPGGSRPPPPPRVPVKWAGVGLPTPPALRPWMSASHLASEIHPPGSEAGAPLLLDPRSAEERLAAIAALRDDAERRRREVSASAAELTAHSKGLRGELEAFRRRGVEIDASLAGKGRTRTCSLQPSASAPLMAGSALAALSTRAPARSKQAEEAASRERQRNAEKLRRKEERLREKRREVDQARRAEAEARGRRGGGARGGGRRSAGCVRVGGAGAGSSAPPALPPRRRISEGRIAHVVSVRAVAAELQGLLASDAIDDDEREVLEAQVMRLHAVLDSNAGVQPPAASTPRSPRSGLRYDEPRSPPRSPMARG